MRRARLAPPGHRGGLPRLQGGPHRRDRPRRLCRHQRVSSGPQREAQWCVTPMGAAGAAGHHFLCVVRRRAGRAWGGSELAPRRAARSWGLTCRCARCIRERSYVPNAGDGRERLEYKLEFLTRLRDKMDALAAQGKQVWGPCRAAGGARAAGPAVTCLHHPPWVQAGWVGGFRSSAQFSTPRALAGKGQRLPAGQRWLGLPANPCADEAH